MPSFSARQGYSGQPKEITIREDAPESLRVTALETALALGMTVNDMRETVCRVLRKRPDTGGNWSYGNVKAEVEYLVYDCEWFRVYDIIEEINKVFVIRHQWSDYEAAINNCLFEEGIGWKLAGGQVVARGDDAFQQSVGAAVQQLNQSRRPTASTHIQWALKALSERPTANTSGAVAQATSAVESLMSDITGEAMTLGQYLNRYSASFHPALKRSLDGVYGYASDAGARHGKEGIEPSFEAAQFAVTTCAAACTLLNATNPKRLS